MFPAPWKKRSQAGPQEGGSAGAGLRGCVSQAGVVDRGGGSRGLAEHGISRLAALAKPTAAAVDRDPRTC